MLVVVGHGHAETYDSDNVEKDDSHERLSDGCGHVLARVGCLAKGNTDKLRSEVGKRGLNDRGPYAQEAAGVSIYEVLVEGAGVLPVVESSSSVIGTATKSDNEADQY